MAVADIFGRNAKKTGWKSRWTVYQGRLHVNTLVGGTPKDPATIRNFLKSRLDIEGDELNAIARDTMEQMSWSWDEDTRLWFIEGKAASPEQWDEMLNAVMAKSGAKGNSFRMVNGSLVYEGRCLKAAFREAANVLYPGTVAWPGHPGKEITRKGLANYLKDRIEPGEMYIPLGRTKPDKTDQIVWIDEPDVKDESRIKHITDRRTGQPQSVIAVVDVVEDVDIGFTLRVLDDCLPEKLFGELLEYIELGGIGADRARGDGRSSLILWAKVATNATQD
jgi:hypothetical protein